MLHPDTVERIKAGDSGQWGMRHWRNNYAANFAIAQCSSEANWPKLRAGVGGSGGARARPHVNPVSILLLLLLGLYTPDAKKGEEKDDHFWLKLKWMQEQRWKSEL